MKVKICGITNANDAIMCEELGADMLGFVHVPGRSRSIPPSAISEIASNLKPGILRVLVCSPSSSAQAIELGNLSGVDAIQSHALTPEDMMSIGEAGFMTIRAIRPDRPTAMEFSSSVDALLFEGGVPGTGTTYDYGSIPMDCHPRTIIAGGLTPENVHMALAMNPHAVDVSSGVEKATGVKDERLVSEFIRKCRA